MAISNRKKKQVLGKVAPQIYAPSLALHQRQLFSAPEWLMCDPSPLPAGTLLHRDVLLNNIQIYLSQHQASCAITVWLVDSSYSYMFGFLS